MTQAKRVLSRSLLDPEVMRLVLAKEVEVITDVSDCFQVKSRRDFVGHMGEIHAARFLRMAGLRGDVPFVNQLPYDLVVNGSITVQVKTTTFRPVSAHSATMQSNHYDADVCPQVFVFVLLVNDQPRTLYVIPAGERPAGSRALNLPLAGVPSHLLAQRGRYMVEVHSAEVFDPAHLRALVLGERLSDHIQTHVQLQRTPTLTLGDRACEWPRWWSHLRRAVCKAVV